jgi:hypothetical protein
MPWRVFLFHGVSNGFTESQAFAGTFAGICEIQKPTYQQFRHAGSYWPSISRDLVNKQYNLKSKNGPLSGAWKEFIFAAVNKWRMFVGLSACNALDQNNSFFRTRRKTIHQAVNPQLGNRASASNWHWLVLLFQLKKEIDHGQAD